MEKKTKESGKTMGNLYASFKKSRWFPLVVGIISILFGILCLANPQAKMESIAMFIGLAVLLYGLFAILLGVLNKEDKKLLLSNIVFGLLFVILAIIIFANLALIGKYLPTLAGFIFILAAIVDLIRSITMLKNGVKTWWISAMPAVVVLVLGFIYLLNPGYVGSTTAAFTEFIRNREKRHEKPSVVKRIMDFRQAVAPKEAVKVRNKEKRLER